MAWSTPRTWSTGELVTAALLNQEVRDNLAAALPVGADAWTAFTPTVKFGATAATIASESRYMRVGRLITANYAFRCTNLNGGTGFFSVSQPVLPKLPAVGSAVYVNPYGVAGLIDISTGNIYHFFVTQNSGTDLTFRSPAFPQATLTHAVPFAIAVGASGTGDEFYATVTYEAAS